MKTIIYLNIYENPAGDNDCLKSLMPSQSDIHCSSFLSWVFLPLVMSVSLWTESRLDWDQVINLTSQVNRRWCFGSLAVALLRFTFLSPSLSGWIVVYHPTELHCWTLSSSFFFFRGGGGVGGMFMCTVTWPFIFWGLPEVFILCCILRASAHELFCWLLTKQRVPLHPGEHPWLAEHSQRAFSLARKHLSAPWRDSHSNLCVWKKQMQENFADNFPVTFET